MVNKIPDIIRYWGKMFYVFLPLILAVTMISSVDGYVLQGPHILDLMVESLGNAKRLWVSQTLQFFNDPEQPDPTELHETLRYLFPETFRADIQADTTQRIHVLSGEESLTIVDGKVETESETRFDLYKDLLLFRSRKLLEKRLMHFGIDVSVSSLGRFREKIFYVIGAVYPDETVPQVWVDKETFLPFRWIVTRTVRENRRDSLEVRYLNWQKVQNTIYPMDIEFHQDDHLVRRIVADAVDIQEAFSPSLFDIAHLKSLNQPSTLEKTGQIQLEELTEVQKTIEEFKKRYE